MRACPRSSPANYPSKSGIRGLPTQQSLTLFWIDWSETRTRSISRAPPDDRRSPRQTDKSTSASLRSDHDAPKRVITMPRNDCSPWAKYAVVTPIHDRMPLVVPSDMYDEWLSTSAEPLQVLNELC